MIIELKCGIMFGYSDLLRVIFVTVYFEFKEFLALNPSGVSAALPFILSYEHDNNWTPSP